MRQLDPVEEVLEKRTGPMENSRPDLAAAGVYVGDCRIFDFFPEKKPLKSGPLDLGFHLVPNPAGKESFTLLTGLRMDRKDRPTKTHHRVVRVAGHSPSILSFNPVRNIFSLFSVPVW